jgi:hypothetical protein
MVFLLSVGNSFFIELSFFGFLSPTGGFFLSLPAAHLYLRTQGGESITILLKLNGGVGRGAGCVGVASMVRKSAGARLPSRRN